MVGVVAVALLLLVVGSATAITISHNHHSQTPTATLVTVNEKSASSDTPTSSALFADSSTTGSDETTTKAETDGASIVQNAIPAVEAYYLDHDDGYAGMTAAALRSDYDQAIARITIIYADATRYCIASVGKPTYYDAGPNGTPTTTPCSGNASIVQNAIPTIEAYYQDHGTYKRMTVATLHSDYDAGITGIAVVYAHADAYCIASIGKPTYYDAGPYGKPTTAPCSTDAASS